MSLREVADTLGASTQTVGKWRRRFLAKRLDGLFDEPRQGAPRKFADAQVEKIVTMTIESKPAAATRTGAHARWRGTAA